MKKTTKPTTKTTLVNEFVNDLLNTDVNTVLTRDMHVLLSLKIIDDDTYATTKELVKLIRDTCYLRHGLKVKALTEFYQKKHLNLTEGFRSVYMYTFPDGKTYVGQTGTNVRYGNVHAYDGQPVAEAFAKYGNNYEGGIILNNLIPSHASLFEILIMEYTNSRSKRSGYNVNRGGIAYKTVAKYKTETEE